MSIVHRNSTLNSLGLTAPTLFCFLSDPNSLQSRTNKIFFEAKHSFPMYTWPISSPPPQSTLSQVWGRCNTFHIYGGVQKKGLHITFLLFAVGCNLIDHKLTFDLGFQKSYKMLSWHIITWSNPTCYLACSTLLTPKDQQQENRGYTMDNNLQSVKMNTFSTSESSVQCWPLGLASSLWKCGEWSLCWRTLEAAPILKHMLYPPPLDQVREVVCLTTIQSFYIYIDKRMLKNFLSWQDGRMSRSSLVSITDYLEVRQPSRCTLEMY